MPSISEAMVEAEGMAAALLNIAAAIRSGVTETDSQRHRIKAKDGTTIEDGWIVGPTADDIRNTFVAVRDMAEAALAAPASAQPEGWPTECATEWCGKPPAIHFIRGNVGAYYCRDCYMRIHKGETARLAALPVAPGDAS